MVDTNNSIGVDIREVTNEFGIDGQILERESGVIYERFQYESNTQMTKPFTAEHFLLTTFTDISSVVVGDLVFAPSQNVHYRVMNVFDEVFENVVIYKQCILYKCNTFVSVYYPKEEIDPITHSVRVTWGLRHGGIAALLTDKLYATRLDDEIQQVMEMDIKGLMLYFPKKFEVEIKDRITISTSDDVYEAMSLEVNTFPGMNVVYLEEDNRVMLPGTDKLPPADLLE